MSWDQISYIFRCLKTEAKKKKYVIENNYIMNSAALKHNGGDHREKKVLNGLLHSFYCVCVEANGMHRHKFILSQLPISTHRIYMYSQVNFTLQRHKLL